MSQSVSEVVGSDAAVAVSDAADEGAGRGADAASVAAAPGAVMSISMSSDDGESAWPEALRAEARAWRNRSMRRSYPAFICSTFVSIDSNSFTCVSSTLEQFLLGGGEFVG